MPRECGLESAEFLWETQLLVIPQEAATEHVDTCLTEGQLALAASSAAPSLAALVENFQRMGQKQSLR